MFIIGILTQITVEHNARSKTTDVLADGKIIIQWTGMELTDPKMLPHNFSLKGQKFTLYWQETDEKDEFALHADG